jgi:hypothetical protein
MYLAGASASLADSLRAAQREPLDTRATARAECRIAFHHAVLHADIAGRVSAGGNTFHEPSS